MGGTLSWVGQVPSATKNYVISNRDSTGLENNIRAVGRTGAPERGGVAPGVKAAVTAGTGLVAMPNEMLANGGTPV